MPGFLHDRMNLHPFSLILERWQNERDVSYHRRAWSQMKWIRYFEAELMRRYEPPHLTRCPIHYCIGQEMAPAYVGEVKEDGDWLFTHHRNHGYWLSWVRDGKATSGELLLRELMGKQTGVNSGRVGSQEISAPFARFYSGAILATMIGIATGTALSYKLEEEIAQGWDVSEYQDPNTIPDLPADLPVIFCAFGDGAADEGIFWEAMNLIALRELPIVLICENNGYATFSAQGRRQARSISDRVQAFGIRAALTVGSPPGAFGTILRQAVDMVRTTRKPIYIEHITYRHCGHVGAHNDDVNEYRPTMERQTWAKNDDLKLLEVGLKELKAVDYVMTAEIERKNTEAFSTAWDAAAEANTAEPIDYTTETTSKKSLIELPLEERYTPEEYREAFLNPY